MWFKVKILYYYFCLSMHKLVTREKLETYQRRKLGKFIHKMLPRAPFYHSFLNGSTHKLTDLPIVDKSIFMENFNHLNTVGIEREEAMEVALSSEISREFNSMIREYTIGLSTGTSGRRGLFLVSEDERAQWAAFVIKNILPFKLFNKQKVAFFLRANSNLYSSVQSAFFEFRYFDIFQPVEKLLQELDNFQPDVVAAQPSVLLDIASAQCEKTINISPAKLISFAEVLTKEDKKYIEKELQSRISEVYQCTEGLLGYSCAEGTMHLNEEFIYFEKEWLNENEFYPILTDFNRKTQLIIRYRLDDVLRVKSEPCKCGSPALALEAILGRSDDYLELSSDNGNIKIYGDLISRVISRYTDSFIHYSITQEEKGVWIVHVDATPNLKRDIEMNLKEAFNQLAEEKGAKLPTLIFKGPPPIPQGQKHRKIINRMRK